MRTARQLTTAELEQGLNDILQSPKDEGALELIVKRPDVDQLYLDMDLSGENLPPGIQLAIGDAIIEVTEPTHTGCKKFAARFGRDAMVFVNSGPGKTLNFRGINARVIQSGDINAGDSARKI